MVQESILLQKSKAAALVASGSGDGSLLDPLKTDVVVYKLTNDRYTGAQQPTEMDLIGHITWHKHIPQDGEMQVFLSLADGINGMWSCQINYFKAWYALWREKKCTVGVDGIVCCVLSSCLVPLRRHSQKTVSMVRFPR